MKITRDLLQKKSEHNEGVLCDLEEISLHQLEIEKIENINKFCPKLQILLLQNNIIEKIENMKRMKDLRYLNLAINNISKIENLEFCEKLNKLDLTLNFIGSKEFKESINNLKKNEELNELYLTGNPCTSWKDYRYYIINNLPNLKQLDGQDIITSERIAAKKSLNNEEQSFITWSGENETIENEGIHTRQSRKEMYQKIEQDRISREEKRNQESNDSLFHPKQNLEIPSVYNSQSEIRQCNQGRFRFLLEEKDEYIIFELFVPKFMNSSLIEVDIQPTYFRCSIKGKITQLRLPSEVAPDLSKVQRSKITGSLKLEMPLISSNPLANIAIE